MHDLIDPILPGGIVGNGKMLCSIRENGELHRLFWPNIDFGQHMGILKIGLQTQGEPVWWLDEGENLYRQFYLEDTNILVTVITNTRNNIEINQADLVLPESDILLRVYRVVNNGSFTRSFSLIAYCSFSIEESGIYDGMYYLPSLGALVQYRRNVFLGLKCLGREPYGFHCGRRNTPSDPIESAGRGEFWGGFDNIKSGAGAMGWKLGDVDPGGTVLATLAIAAAHSEGSLTGLLSSHAAAEDEAGNMELTSRYWKKWLNQPEGKEYPDTPLFKRSLLAIKIMSDKTSGASLAAPEFDSHYIASGGYGYCWPRDGVFVALALDEAGHHQEAEAFYRFAVKVQKPDGSWFQRYFMNGDWAPAWGGQIDQTGAVLWGYHHHFKITGDKDFLNHIWPSVYSGAGYLVNNRWENGLQIPTMDIWEDEFAQSTYSSAAVYGGLKGAAGLASAIGDSHSGRIWEEAAETLKESILALQWLNDRGTFARSVNRRICESDYCRAVESGQEALILPVPGTSFTYHAAPVDHRLDAAVLGLCFPFGVIPANDPRMQSAADSIVKTLSNSTVGGIHRYQGDSYAGGNPWVLITLWMSIYQSLRGNRELALEYIKWAEVNSSPAGLLPEQAHRHNGGPAWVLPLNWSHAMYVLASLALYGKLSFI
ncbi:MAG: glycoside hydrolase family 15 protein [Bacillota bacterium]